MPPRRLRVNNFQPFSLILVLSGMGCSDSHGRTNLTASMFVRSHVLSLIGTVGGCLLTTCDCARPVGSSQYGWRPSFGLISYGGPGGAPTNQRLRLLTQRDCLRLIPGPAGADAERINCDATSRGPALPFHGIHAHVQSCGHLAASL